jgi:hypothetical protein
MLRCATCPRTRVEEALLAVGRSANPHGQAVCFGLVHVLCKASQAVAHAPIELLKTLAAHESGGDCYRRQGAIQCPAGMQ